MPIPPARVAWYVTGRFYEDDKGLLQDLGYFLYLAGVEAPLFNGPIGEATALLTFRSDPFQAQTLTNGNISIGLDAVGDFSIYLNPRRGASFDDPDSFSRGQRVQWGTSSANPLATFPPYQRIVAFTGSAIAASP